VCPSEGDQESKKEGTYGEVSGKKGRLNRSHYAADERRRAKKERHGMWCFDGWVVPGKPELTGESARGCPRTK